MSIEISVSYKSEDNPSKLHNFDKGCSDIINAFIKSKLEGKFTPNISIINNKIENGCLVTMAKDYTSKERLGEIWNIIKKSSKKENEYKCAYIKIDGVYQGCILNYLAQDKCPYNNSNNNNIFSYILN